MTPIERYGLGQARRQLLGELTGTILDVGAGTGVNFPYFAEPTQVVACEPNSKMRRRAEKRRPAGLTLLDCSAESLAVDDGSFDHIITTLVLCTVADLEAAFGEFRRVLKPGGHLHFIEHVRGEGFTGQLHDWCTPLWSKIAGGCHLNRCTVELIREAGFQVEREDTVWRLLNTPFVAGSARV